MDSSVIDALIHTSSGDLRRAITYLQSASRLSSSSHPPTRITALDIQEIAGVVPDAVVNDFAAVLGIEIEGGMDVDSTGRRNQNSFDPIRNKVKALIREGFSATQILTQVSHFAIHCIVAALMLFSSSTTLLFFILH